MDDQQKKNLTPEEELERKQKIIKKVSLIERLIMVVGILVVLIVLAIIIFRSMSGAMEAVVTYPLEAVLNDLSMSLFIG